MSKKIYQFQLDASAVGYNILEEHRPVTQLGIQAPPGTTFQINGGSLIEVGIYGIYELDLENIGGQINYLNFIYIPQNTSYKKILVDIIYEDLKGTNK